MKRTDEQSRPAKPAAAVQEQPQHLAVVAPGNNLGLDRAALLRRALEGLQSASDYDLQQIVFFIEIIENLVGSNTPAEEFITGLVLTHGRDARDGRGLTPDDAANDLEVFRQEFDSMVVESKNFAAQYSKLLAPAK